MQQHSVVASKVNWTRLRQNAFELAAGAQTPAATYSAIGVALADLGDHHSRLIPPPSATSDAAPDQQPSGGLLSGRVGKLLIPAVTATAATSAYAQRVQNLMQKLSGGGACRWMIDLRTNTGGDMWPMLAGLAPLLTRGTVGYFVTPGQPRQTWIISPNAASLDGKTMVSVAKPATISGSPSVAILTGPLTGSSAEAVIIAFQGQSHTRTFGAPTYGVPSANNEYALPDGATLVLTTAHEADRTGHVYPLTTPLQPDQATSPADINRADQTPGADEEAATRWLATQSCS